MWLCLSTANADKVETLMEGSGYKPFTTTINGERRAIARVSPLNYRDTDNGPYRAFILAFDAYKDDGGPARTFDWVNPYSTLAPAASGAQMYFYRGAATGDHVPTAHELLGLDKRQGNVEMTLSDGGGDTVVETTKASDLEGREIASANISIDQSPRKQLQEANEMAHAFGLADAPQLPPMPVFHFPSYNPDPANPGKFKSMDAFYTWQPFVERWGKDDSLRFGKDSEFGKVLDSLEIKPEVVVRDPHMKMSLTPEVPGKPEV